MSVPTTSESQDGMLHSCKLFSMVDRNCRVGTSAFGWTFASVGSIAVQPRKSLGLQIAGIAASALFALRQIAPRLACVRE
ncbi:hypothetical protein ASG54_12690 [Aureimonas sp. Leaf460]|nr:hypothetical protein ASG62_08825 [Aureimonas sp. Leaf427]KQT77096.1 hypothetical protein ASG54_12690 [Aureimonas sp. Leaf460]